MLRLEPKLAEVFRVLVQQGRDGATDTEGATACNMSRKAYASRRCELKTMGLVTEARGKDGAPIKRGGPRYAAVVWVAQRGAT